MENVVLYREFPQQVLMVDGEPYISLKDFRAMTGLQADSPFFAEVADQIIERLPTGRQRKPRQYISVEGCAKLWTRSMRTWLLNRIPASEQETFIERDERGRAIRVKHWHWFGEAKVAAMFGLDLEPFEIMWDEETKNFAMLFVESDPLLAMSIGKRTEEWVRYHVPAPSLYGKLRKHVVLDVTHPEFAELLAYLKGWSLETAKQEIELELQAETQIREAKWQAKHHGEIREVTLLESVYNAEEGRRDARVRRHARLNESFATAIEAASEAEQDDFDLETIMQAHPGAFESVR